MLLANAHRILEAKGACNLLSNGSQKCVCMYSQTKTEWKRRKRENDKYGKILQIGESR